MEKRDTSQKTGIALGSGAARGMAHIGVLRALEDAGQKPGFVAGTSIGALVGGVYAAGKLDELTDIVLALDWKQAASFFLEASFPRSGLIEGNKVTEFLAKILGRRKIRDLPIPFRAVATEITSGREVVIDDGDVVARFHGASVGSAAGVLYRTLSAFQGDRQRYMSGRWQTSFQRRGAVQCRCPNHCTERSFS